MKEKLINLSKERLESQTRIPLSPGCVEEDEPLLCLGAALVASYIELVDCRDNANVFARQIVDRSSDDIVRFASRVGFSTSLCQSAIVANDKLGDQERRLGTFTFLDQLMQADGDLFPAK